MTTIGNDLTVDGTITANQATQAGEAVVLGDDGLIPANLVASGGGKVETPYFYIDSTAETCSLIKGNSSKQSYYETSQHGTFGTGVQVNNTFHRPTILPGYGAVATNFYAKGGSASSSSTEYYYTIGKDKTQLLLNNHIRTNLRGEFRLNTYVSVVNSSNYYIVNSSQNLDITISDDGIIVNTGNYNVCSSDDSLTSGKVFIMISGIEMKSLPEWC